MFFVLFLTLRSSKISKINKKSFISHKNDEYKIDVDETKNYDDSPNHQNDDFGEPPPIWIAFATIVSIGILCVIICAIRGCCKERSKKRAIAESALINPDDSYHNAIPPVIPQTDQGMYSQQSYPQYCQQPYQVPPMQYQQSYTVPPNPYQQPYGQAGAEYPQPFQQTNII